MGNILNPVPCHQCVVVMGGILRNAQGNFAGTSTGINQGIALMLIGLSQRKDLLRFHLSEGVSKSAGTAEERAHAMMKPPPPTYFSFQQGTVEGIYCSFLSGIVCSSPIIGGSPSTSPGLGFVGVDWDNNISRAAVTS